jgi:superoxide dismutase, Cu-Zn family
MAASRDRRKNMRTIFLTALVAAAVAGGQVPVPAPGGAGEVPMDEVAARAAAGPARGMSVVLGRFGPYRPTSPATTYRTDLVPDRAPVAVARASLAGRTAVLLVTAGLVPNREYGAHVHVRPCGPDPADAGPHYQNRPDPLQPSTDPRYANPENEIWLDFTTDARGRGISATTVDWVFREHRARSVVLHETHTHTEPGQAGTAGARLACVTVGF